jgi:hypothetical protein
MDFNAAATTVMSISGSGNVGIGTTTPSHPIHIVDASTTQQIVVETTGGGSYSDIAIKSNSHKWSISTGGSSTDSAYDGNFYIYDHDNSAQRLVISGSGQVMIGSATAYDANTKLTVKTDGSNDWGILVTDNSNAPSVGLFVNGSGAGEIQAYKNDQSTVGLRLTAEDNANSYFNSGGNVGIGNSSPEFSLDIADGAYSAGKKVCIGANHNGGTTIVNDMASLILGPKGQRTGTTNHYNGGGIAFNHLLRWNNTFDSAWNNHMHAYIGTRLKDTASAEASHLIFATNDGDNQNESPTERMVIESDGNVGIGTTAPISTLDVRSSSIWRSLTVGGDGGTDIVVIGNSDNIAQIGAHNSAADAWANLAINKGGGDVGIGTAVPKTALHVQGDATTSLTTCGALRFTGNNGASGNMQTIEWTDSDSRNEPAMSIGYLGENPAGQGWGSFFVMTTTGSATGASIRFKVVSGGDTYTNDGSVSSLSDKRAKKNIIDLEDGLSIVNQLKPKTFQYNGKTDLGVDDGKTRFGFIADDVLEVASQYVEIGSAKIDGAEVDDFKSLSTGRMIPMMVKAIQELSTANDELKAQIEALENA